MKSEIDSALIVLLIECSLLLARLRFSSYRIHLNSSASSLVLISLLELALICLWFRVEHPLLYFQAGCLSYLIKLDLELFFLSFQQKVSCAFEQTVVSVYQELVVSPYHFYLEGLLQDF